MPSEARQYVAGRFDVELDGTAAGKAAAVGGGGAVGEVASEKVGADFVVRKHISNLTFEDVELQVGSEMSAAFYDWIASTFDSKFQRKDGTVRFLDYNFIEKSKLTWSRGLISEIGFPAVDASAKEAAFLTVKVRADSTKQVKGSGAKGGAVSGSSQLRWLANNFRLTIDDVDCSHVTRIEATPVEVHIVEDAVGEERDVSSEPAHLEIPNLVITVDEAHAADFVAWHEDFVIKGNNGQGAERKGKLEYLSAYLKDVLFTLGFEGLGIVRVSPVKSVNGPQAIARVEVELYCEEMSFGYLKAPAPMTGSTGTTSSQPSGFATLLDPNAALVTALRSLLIGGGSPVPLAMTARPAESVAARLLTGAGNGRAVEAEAVGGSGDQGRRLGAEWARERASLDELEQLAAMQGDDWSHLELGEDHSLLGFLADQAIIIHVFSGGPVDLERDEFVEGLVEGAADVYQEVRPHLGERARARDIG